MSRFQTMYHDVIVPELTKKFGYKTIMQVPRITKITLNMGVGEAVNDKKMVDNAVADMTKIAGQKPAVTRTRKAIANFKIRENMPIGCMVTLRGERMYDFLDRLITIAFPRVRDFRGDRCDPWYEHFHYDDGQDRRRSQGASRGLPLPVPQLSRRC